MFWIVREEARISKHEGIRFQISINAVVNWTVGQILDEGTLSSVSCLMVTQCHGLRNIDSCVIVISVSPCDNYPGQRPGGSVWSGSRRFRRREKLALKRSQHNWIINSRPVTFVPKISASYATGISYKIAVFACKCQGSTHCLRNSIIANNWTQSLRLQFWPKSRNLICWIT